MVNTKSKIKKGEKYRNQSGFTLIEVLVSSAILVILAIGFLGLQYIMSQNQLTAWRDYLSIESGNVALSAVARELRDARQSDTGSYALELANDQEIIFYSDIDYDDIVERVRYTLSGTNLEKGIIEPTGEPLTYPLANESVRIISDIVRNGADPVFFYYNEDWPIDTVNNPLVQSERIANTREVKIVLRTNPQANEPDKDYLLESNVKLRMLF